MAYSNNNSLVVTDYAANLRRIDLIVDALDRPGGGEPVVNSVQVRDDGADRGALTDADSNLG